MILNIQYLKLINLTPKTIFNKIRWTQKDPLKFEKFKNWFMEPSNKKLQKTILPNHWVLILITIKIEILKMENCNKQKPSS